MKIKSVVMLLCLLGIGMSAGAGKVRAVSEEEFQTLKRKVEQMEKYTVPPEPSDEIKKVSEYVCANGHTFSAPPKDNICPEDGLKVAERSTLIKIKLNRREAVGEKIGAMMEEEFKKRVSVAISGTGIVQHVTDSLEPGTTKQTFSQGSVDVYLLSRPMKNSLFFIDLEAQGGQGPDSAVANNSVLNNDTTSLPAGNQADQVRLREAWLQVTGFVQKVQFVAGKIDLTNYFDSNRAANDETSQFLTGTLVNNPLIGNPANSPGAVLMLDSRRGLSLTAGVQSADASGINATEQPFSIAEVGLRTRLLAGNMGNFRFWGSRNGRTSGLPTVNRDDYALGISADQEVGPYAVVFGRFGRAYKKNQLRCANAWSAGLMIHDLISPRRRDKIGIGYSHYLTTMDPGLTGETENIGEIYYSIYMTEHLSISPVGQYLMHSAGTATAPAQSSVLILGLRTQIDF